MSTAARPTFHAAQGRTSYGGSFSRNVSVKDQAAHTKLKYRQYGQASSEEMSSKDLKGAISQNENKLIKDKILTPKHVEEKITLKLLTNEATSQLDEIRKKYDDSDVFNDNDDDDKFDSSSEEESDNEDDDDEDDDDDELELQRELNRIKAERAAVQALKDEEDRLLTEKLQYDSAIRGNPLVQLDSSSSSGTAKMKRKWNDDVVFKNQANDNSKNKKGFINDTIRNDFHKSFLKKYIK